MTDTFINISGGAETATYTVTPVYNGCTGQPKTIIVTVGSQPVLDPNLNRAVCSGLPTGLVLAVAPSSSPATSYDIYSITAQTGLVVNPSNALAANGITDVSYLASDMFINETGTDRTVTYRVRPVFGLTCIGDWVDVVVTVRPQPVILPGQVKTVCSNTPVNKEILFVPVNTPAGSTFSWPVPVMSDGSIQGTAGVAVPADPAGTLHITDVFGNYGVSPITATYTVTPSSSYGCAGNPVDVVITVNPEPPAPVISGRDKLCVGETNIVYTVPLTPGSTYTWTVPASVGTKVLDFNSNAIVINAAASAGNGDITVIEHNSYGCSGPAGSFHVEVMAPSPVSTITGDNAVCALETGVYSVPNNAGSTYYWTLPTGAALIGDPSAASVTVTFGTVSGSITVRETNAAGCVTNHTPLPVTVRPLPTAIISNSGTICVEGSHPVNIALTGTSPWSVVYAINGVDQPAINNILSSPYTLNVNAAGNYTITSVTDANNCTNTGIGNATVTYYPVPTATISGSTEICAGGSAVITITLTGAAPYDFVYTDGTTPVTVTNYPSMVYTATVTPAVNTTYTITSMNDNNGCLGTFTGNAIITINPTPVLSLSGTNLKCNGDNSGAIDLTVTAGAAPFSYAWTGPDGYTAGSEDISGLKAGYYAVTVTDGKGCHASANITLAQPAVLTLTKSGDISLLCFGATDGAGSFTAAGGTLPYSFTDPVNTSGATLTPGASSVAVTNAGAGTITVQVTDANNCTAQATINVTQPAALGVTAVLSKSIEGSHNINCFGGNTGTISTTVTGGVAPYIYTWTTPDGSGLVAGASNQSGLTAGTYNVTVTDANGCQVTGSWTLTQPTALTVTAATDDSLIGTCSDAQLSATVAGGVMPAGGYLYSWSPAAGLSAANIANPVAAPASTTTYTVTVTDANGCIRTSAVTVNVAPVLTAVAFADDNLIGACPSSDAQLDVTVNGGEAPYSYSWLPVAGLSAANIRNPAAKPAVNTTYTVTVTDANGCTVTADVTINVAPPLTATAAVDDDPIGECPSSVAHLSTTVTGGEGGYSYLWDNAGTLNDATRANPTAKPASSTLYTVTVTDANGCTTTAQVQVNVAPPLTVTASADDYIIGTCPSSVAHLDATGAGGELLLSGDYIYNWSPAAGLNYTNVKSPVAKPAATTTYTVTITDRNGCTATGQVTITVNPPIALTTTPLVYAGGYNITCNGASDGAIDLGVTGGEAPYTYAWTGPSGFTSASEDISGLIAGTYNVTVTDANNCTSTTTAFLLEPAILTLGKTPDVVLACFGDATASGSFNVSGGTSPYIISVISDNTGASVTITGVSLSFTGAAAGTLTAGVTDANGCTAQASIVITEPPQLMPGSIDGTQEVCYLGNPAPLSELTPPSGGPATILFQWESSIDGGSAWNIVPGANASSYDPPAGILQTTQYRRKVTSGTCDPEYSNVVTVTVNPLPAASIAGTGFVCPGDAATVTVTVTTGESPYTVVLSDGTTVPNYISGTPITVAPVATTTYTVTSVTDNNGCVVSAPHANLTGSATIDVKIVPEIVLQPLNITVCEDDIATFATNAGATTNPSYQWYVDTGSGMVPIAGEIASTLSVTATSAMNGNKYQVVISGDCPVPVTSDIVVLTVNEKPEIVAQPADVTLCAGEDAVFTAGAGVTTSPVYQWFVNSGTGWTPAVGARYQGATTNTLTVVSALEAMSGYRYFLRVTGTCAPAVNTDTVTLSVTRQAEITQHPASLILCEGAPAGFTVNAGLTTNPSYQWEISTDGGLSWAPIAGATGATYTIAAVASSDNSTAYRAIVSSSCGSSVTSLPAFLTVNEQPEISDQPDDVTICEYAIADFMADAGVTTGAAYRWQRSTDGGVTWNNLTESATYFGVSTMNLKVNGTLRTMSGDQFRVIVSGTCLPPDTSDVAHLTVDTAPEILAQPVSSSICENANTLFTVNAQGTAITYQWYVDTGTGFTPVSDGGVYSGATTSTLTLTTVPRGYDNYRYRVEVQGTCAPKAVSTTVQLDVSIETIINVQPADSAICEFMTAGFSVQADGANLRYQWQVFTGSGWSDLTNTGIYQGVKTQMLMLFGPSRTMDGTRYRVIIGSDCTADIVSSEAMLTVYTAPEISDHPDEFRGCPGGSATFSVVAAGTGLEYQWQVNSGSGFADVSDDATYSGTATADLTINNLTLAMNGYLIRVVVSGTCLPPVTSSFAPLRVYAEPSIIKEPDDAEVCDKAGTYFMAQVFSTGAGETTVWQVNEGTGWNSLSDGALYQGTQTPQLIIMSATTAMNGWQYRLEITGPCGQYYTREALLTVNAPPTAQINPTDTLLVCGGVPAQLHGNPAGGSLDYVTHRWYGDIGPLSQYNIENPVFNTSMPGYYRLIYQVTDSKGCVGLDTVVVEVEKPVAMFTIDTPSGCQPLTVNFTNGSSGYASVLWDFGDSQTSTEVSPSHTYPNTGTSLAYYTVTLQVTSSNGCVSEMQNNVTVFPEILSDFVVSDDTICSGESVMLSTLPGAYRYFWTYGDGQQEYGSNVITHTYMNSGTTPVTYIVKLTAESFFGCLSETTIPLVVYPTPVPAFIASPVSQTFPSATVTFANNTNAGTWTWLWNFDDGNTSADMSPVHTYAAPGNFAVSLTVSNGICSETVTRNVSVLPTPPIADFDSIPSGCMPWNISINNTSLYATDYFWDFGDGHTSNAKNPVYTYLQAGTYQITLTVTGPGGTDTESQIISVYQAPKAYFEISPTQVYVNDEKVRLFNLTEGGDSFIWEFGDGDTSHLRDPYHKYTKEGIYDITLHAYSANGCYDTYVKSPAVTVVPFGDLVFASVFKPNPDGPIEIDQLPTSGESMDQFFFPPIRETVLEYHLQIFNRWGTLIYETWDINKPWNGYYKGTLCAQGVYVWLVEGKYANGKPYKKAGDITLLH
jgi:PKD repeat protein